MTDLRVGHQVVVLLCLLLNVYAGWHFYVPLHDNGWGDFDDYTWRRDTERRNTVATILDPRLTTGHEAMDTSYVPVQSFIYHWSVNVTGQEASPIRVLGLVPVPRQIPVPRPVWATRRSPSCRRSPIISPKSSMRSSSPMRR